MRFAWVKRKEKPGPAPKPIHEMRRNMAKSVVRRHTAGLARGGHLDAIVEEITGLIPTKWNDAYLKQLMSIWDRELQLLDDRRRMKVMMAVADQKNKIDAARKRVAEMDRAKRRALGKPHSPAAASETTVASS